MKSSLLLTITAILAGATVQNQEPAVDFVAILQDAFDNQRSNIQVFIRNFHISSSTVTTTLGF